MKVIGFQHYLNGSAAGFVSFKKVEGHDYPTIEEAVADGWEFSPADGEWVFEDDGKE